MIKPFVKLPFWQMMAEKFPSRQSREGNLHARKKLFKRGFRLAHDRVGGQTSAVSEGDSHTIGHQTAQGARNINLHIVAVVNGSSHGSSAIQLLSDAEGAGSGEGGEGPGRSERKF